MKKLRSIGAILFAICMLLSMSLNALVVSAETVDAGGGGIVGSINIHKYSKPSTDVGLPPSNGQVIDTSELVGKGLQPLNDITFRITRAFVKSNELIGSELPDSYRMSEEEVYSGKTDKNGNVSFINLPLGVYYVQELDDSGEPMLDELDNPLSFFVSIPTRINGEDKHDIHVYPKNKVGNVPDINKKLLNFDENEDLDILGNILDWEISAEIPEDIANAESYVITDTLDPRLSYVNNTIKIYATETDTVTETVLNSGIDYAFTSVNTLTIILQDSGRKKLAELDTNTLYVKFQTRVIDPSGWEGKYDSITNEAVINYTDSHSFEYTPGVSNPVEVKDLHGIEIYKVDRDDTPLRNAVFNIYETAEDAEEAIAEGTNDKVAPTEKALKGADGKFLEVMTNSEGIAYVHLLKPGETYYLVEKEAPGGYRLLTDYVQVTTTTSNAGPIYDKDSQFVSVKIVNSGTTNFTLPQTGGAGTLWFTFAGLSLIGTAIVVYTISKKKKHKKLKLLND